MNQVQRERLLKLPPMLRDVAVNELPFDMGYEVESECGTPACVLGHYASRRDLQKTFIIRKGGEFGEYYVYHRSGLTSLIIDDHRVRDHFGLTAGECRELFDSSGCDHAETPIEAADYIESFIENHD